MSSSTSNSEIDQTDDRHPWRSATKRSAPALMLSLLLVGTVSWFANQRLAHYPLAETSAHRKFAAIEQPRHYDAVIIGMSRGHFGVDPRCFPEGGTYYNLALPGAAGRMTRVMVDRFLDAGNTARYVLFEINPLTFDAVGAWRRPYHDADAIGSAWADELQYRTYGSDTFETARYHWETTPLWSRRGSPEWFFFGVGGRENKACALDAQDDLDRYVMGHIPLDDRPIPPRERGKTVRKVSSRKNPLCPEEVAAVEALIARLQAAGTKVILFEAPLCDYTTVGEPYEQYKTEVERIVREYQLTHLNYREHKVASATTDDEKYFWDRTHLSQSGATLFSKELWRDAGLSLTPLDSPASSPQLATFPEDRGRKARR
ncbi:MAG: hypothetical protein WD065_03450 [Planctomycetaceae bacterium]